MIEAVKDSDEAELHLRIRQLEAAETRTSLIVRALTCFYIAVSGFVSCALISLVGAVFVSVHLERSVPLCFAIAFVAGILGVSAMIAGAIMLVRETRYSFRILREESKFLTQRARHRVRPDSELSQAAHL